MRLYIVLVIHSAGTYYVHPITPPLLWFTAAVQGVIARHGRAEESPQDVIVELATQTKADK